VKKQKKSFRRDAGRSRGNAVIQRILKHTLSELAAVGLDGLSIECVAELAEVNKTSIYRRWPTKEALVAAALEGIVQNVTAQMPDTKSLETDLVFLLTQVAQVTTHASGKALMKAVLSESLAPHLANLAAAQLAKQTQNPVRILVRRAKARNEWRSGVNPQHLIGALVGAVIHRVFFEHAKPTQKWIRSLVKVVIHGVLPNRQ
jgi:AcrR family transcriptional regulator